MIFDIVVGATRQMLGKLFPFVTMNFVLLKELVLLINSPLGFEDPWI